MNREELIFVTGATGFLGARLVRELLDRYPDATLALLIRDRPGQSGRQRADLIVPEADRSRVEVFSETWVTIAAVLTRPRGSAFPRKPRA
jgi:thioester reductase-like protein